MLIVIDISFQDSKNIVKLSHKIASTEGNFRRQKTGIGEVSKPTYFCLMVSENRFGVIELPKKGEGFKQQRCWTN